MKDNNIEFDHVAVDQYLKGLGLTIDLLNEYKKQFCTVTTQDDLETALKKRVRHEVLDDFGDWIHDDILEKMRIGLECAGKIVKENKEETKDV